MKMICITERGDDKNDGATLESAVYSWKRALQLSLKDGRGYYIPDDVTMQRIHAEIAQKLFKK
jgi:hypothetical protein